MDDKTIPQFDATFKDVTIGMLKDAIWQAVVVQGQDTMDRCYKSVMAQFGMSDQEIRAFCDAMYEEECRRYGD